ncbi:zf-HC2 domain-containing protein [Streptomyces sp. NPDC002054]|uniref:zf-HC2 domain-containing protein n=1 Tax=Streptomyces sp. NPDC002054 TaxID=3154663 RepID=UPI003333D5FE
MSGASPSPSPAEQHLGDRLAALVDGELSHDARERVLAHLATCPRCKAEADAQRRLKTLFVESAPPPPSAGLLARLQGLPGLPGGPGAPGMTGLPGVPSMPGVQSAPGADTFGFVLPTAPPGSQQRQGFPIHEVGRPRRRFAFVAAGAVSLAAIALGGTLPMETRVEPNARGEGGAASVTPSARPGVTGGAVPVSDAVVRTRQPSPSLVAGWRPAAHPAHPAQPAPTPAAPSHRPVSLTR